MTMIQLIACIGMIAGQYPCRYQRDDQAKKGGVPPA